MNQPISLGVRIRLWREHLGVTQSVVADRAGLSHNALSRIETGNVSPKLETIERIASALDVSVEQIQFLAPKSSAEPVLKIGKHLDQLITEIRQIPEERQKRVIDMLLTIVREVQ